MRIFSRIKASERNYLPVDGYFGGIFFTRLLVGNAEKPASVVTFRSALILIICLTRNIAQICNSVICANAIDMIDV